jgi:hypothetical protein
LLDRSRLAQSARRVNFNPSEGRAMNKYLQGFLTVVVSMVVINTIIKRAPAMISGPVSKVLEGL